MTTATFAIPCRHERRFRFDPVRTALLAIDMQRDFLDPRGMCALGGADVAPLRAIIPNLARITAAARQAGLAVIHTRETYAPDLSDVHPLKAERDSIGRTGPLGRFLIAGETGHDFIDELRPAPGEPVIDKPGFGAFYRTQLEQVLRGSAITHLVLTGVTTQCCVQSTLREAVDRGFYCLTVSDACAAFDPDLHDATLSMIAGEDHLFGWISDTAALLAGLPGASQRRALASRP